MQRPQEASVTTDSVLAAYRHGYFPMANGRGEIGFFAYEPRGIIPLDEGFHIRRSLRQVLNREMYEIRFDTSPEEVLQACSREGIMDREEIWLSQELIVIYRKLFSLGILHTVEVWSNGNPERGDIQELLGGLYGLQFGGAFCGESMFSKAPYASQMALVHLVERLRAKGFTLLDAQMSSEHLKQFGLREITQAEYMELFVAASQLAREF